MIDIFEIGTIKRLPLETSYTNVVAIVHALLLRCPAGTELIIDGTGVGKPVADIFKWHGVTPWCVTATAGIEQTIDAATAASASSPSPPLIPRSSILAVVARIGSNRSKSLFIVSSSQTSHDVNATVASPSPPAGQSDGPHPPSRR